MTLIWIYLTDRLNIVRVLLHQAIKQLINNTFKVTKQNDIDPNGFYCGGRINRDEFINWNQKSIEIHNFIRALPLNYTQKHTIRTQ